ncbi:MAG: hypothetical protein QXR57_06800 [Metallosphaera sp.]|uniref:Uncharacterized protein n=1 Tax=Metallosphaera cuprina (strain Ar-4) TaxID=1006006 RepID=F4FZG3_METCR|nr:hypothetical protein [Metallosphaera cuprina]AEB95653.1 conserved hypothetical protein [Metallosphaera cuprina Ar-4]
MPDIVTDEKGLVSFLASHKGEDRLTVVINEAVLRVLIPVIRKYDYALIDAEDLPNKFFKLTLEYRSTRRGD